jgi:hypothetical protein
MASRGSLARLVSESCSCLQRSSTRVADPAQFKWPPAPFHPQFLPHTTTGVVQSPTVPRDSTSVALAGATGQFGIEVGLQVLIEGAGCQRYWAAAMRLEIQILAYNQRHTYSATRNVIPGLALGERGGFTADIDRRDHSRGAQGDVRSASMENAALLRFVPSGNITRVSPSRNALTPPSIIDAAESLVMYSDRATAQRVNGLRHSAAFMMQFAAGVTLSRNTASTSDG